MTNEQKILFRFDKCNVIDAMSGEDNLEEFSDVDD